MDDIKLKTINSIGYNAMFRLISMLCQFLASIILSRRLSPSDYGIIGFSLIFIQLLSQFDDLGINSAVIQRKQLDERAIQTAFTIKAVIGLALCVVAFIIAPLAHFFFENPAVINVIRLLSLNFVINIFIFLPNSVLRRELNYKKMSLAKVLSSILNSVLSIILAIMGLKYWSIALANLISTILLALAMNMLKPVSTKISFDKKIAAEFIHYGWKLFASGIIIFVLFNADNFIVGSVKGSILLGYYVVAFNWGAMSSSLMYSIIHDVLFPTFTNLRHDKEKLKAAYLKTLEYISFMGVLMNMTLFIIAKDFLVHVLGHGSDKWMPALPALKILCIYGIFRSILEPVGNIIMAVGKTEVLLKSNMIAALLQVVFIYPAIKYFSIEGAAVIVSLAYCSQYFVYFPFLKRELNLPMNELMMVLKPSIISILALLPIYIVSEYCVLNSSSILIVAEKLIVCSLSYMVIFGFLTKWKLLKEAKTVIEKGIG